MMIQCLFKPFQKSSVSVKDVFVMTSFTGCFEVGFSEAGALDKEQFICVVDANKAGPVLLDHTGRMLELVQVNRCS